MDYDSDFEEYPASFYDKYRQRLHATPQSPSHDPPTCTLSAIQGSHQRLQRALWSPSDSSSSDSSGPPSPADTALPPLRPTPALLPALPIRSDHHRNDRAGLQITSRGGATKNRIAQPSPPPDIISDASDSDDEATPVTPPRSGHLLAPRTPKTPQRVMYPTAGPLPSPPSSSSRRFGALAFTQPSRDTSPPTRPTNAGIRSFRSTPSSSRSRQEPTSLSPDALPATTVWSPDRPIRNCVMRSRRPVMEVSDSESGEDSASESGDEDYTIKVELTGPDDEVDARRYATKCPVQAKSCYAKGAGAGSDKKKRRRPGQGRDAEARKRQNKESQQRRRHRVKAEAILHKEHTRAHDAIRNDPSLRTAKARNRAYEAATERLKCGLADIKRDSEFAVQIINDDAA